MAYLSRRRALTMLAAAPIALLAARTRSPVAAGRAALRGRDVAAAMPAANQGAPPAVDGDATALIALSQQALQRAQTAAADAVLRQIDIVWGGQERIFRFTDAAATQEITVSMPDSTVAPAQWVVFGGQRTSPLTTRAHPDIGVQALRVGPAAAAQAMLGYTPGSDVLSMTLTDYPSTGNALAWYVFSGNSGWSISAIVDGTTGSLRPNGPDRPSPVPVTVP